MDELSRDAEEHAYGHFYGALIWITLVMLFFGWLNRAVITTLKEAQAKDPNRKCFRMIGGVLVQRAVKEILPSLETNLQGVSKPFVRTHARVIELNSTTFPVFRSNKSPNSWRSSTSKR